MDVEIVAQLRVHKGRYKDRYTEEIGGFQYAPLVGIVLGEIFADKFVQNRWADRARAIELIDNLADNLLDGIEIGFGLKGIRNPVELAARQLCIVVGWVILVVLQSDGRYEAMGHERSSRGNSVG